MAWAVLLTAAEIIQGAQVMSAVAMKDVASIPKIGIKEKDNREEVNFCGNMCFASQQEGCPKACGTIGYSRGFQVV
jgi:hypothetical protein